MWWGTFHFLPKEDDWSKRGQFGDLFGSVNALFSGFAFAGIIYTIYLQRKDLKLQEKNVTAQMELTREHNKLSVRPLIEFHYFTDPKDNVRCGIENYGLGPAIIESLICTYDKKEYQFKDRALHTILENICETNSLNYCYNAMSKDTPFSAGMKIDLISFPNTEGNRTKHELAINLLSQLNFKLAYKSIYEEEFSINFRT
jgi:hypothetical protein